MVLVSKMCNRSELNQGAVSQILFPIYIALNGAIEISSAQLEADHSKSVNPTDKVPTIERKKTSVAPTLENITVLE